MVDCENEAVSVKRCRLTTMSRFAFGCAPFVSSAFALPRAASGRACSDEVEMAKIQSTWRIQRGKKE